MNVFISAELGRDGRDKVSRLLVFAKIYFEGAPSPLTACLQGWKAARRPKTLISIKKLMTIKIYQMGLFVRG